MLYFSGFLNIIYQVCTRYTGGIVLTSIPYFYNDDRACGVSSRILDAGEGAGLVRFLLSSSAFRVPLEGRGARDGRQRDVTEGRHHAVDERVTLRRRHLLDVHRRRLHRMGDASASRLLEALRHHRVVTYFFAAQQFGARWRYGAVEFDVRVFRFGYVRHDLDALSVHLGIVRFGLRLRSLDVDTRRTVAELRYRAVEVVVLARGAGPCDRQRLTARPNRRNRWRETGGRYRAGRHLYERTTELCQNGSGRLQLIGFCRLNRFVSAHGQRLRCIVNMHSVHLWRRIKPLRLDWIRIESADRRRW